MNGPLNNQDRAKKSILVFWISFGFAIAMIILSSLHYNELQNMDISEAEDSNISLTIGILALVNIIVYITGIVFFIQWFRRAYHNLERAGMHIDHKEGWAAGYWFVPFLNLIRPYQIMIEIWNKTQLGIEDNRMIKPTTLLGWWWTFWIVGNIVDYISFRLELSGEYISSLTTGIAGSALELGGLYLIILIIEQVSEFEDELYKEKSNIDTLDHLIS